MPLQIEAVKPLKHKQFSIGRFLQSGIDKSFINNDNTPLLHIGSKPWTLSNAFEGVLCFGGTGSGKSSGVARQLAHAYLKAGMGGLVLCTKPNDADDWHQYAKETGRTHACIFMNESAVERFNFLDYEMTMATSPMQAVSNLTHLFLNIAEASNPQSKSQPQDAFWKQSVTQLIRNTLMVLIAARGCLRINDIKEFLVTIPRKDNPNQGGFASIMLDNAFAKALNPLSEQDKTVLYHYFAGSLYHMSDKTYTNILATFESIIFPLDSGLLHTLFSTHTTLVPDMAHHGAIIIIDLPVKQHFETGLLAAHIWKYLFQRAAERRNVKANPRGLFLFVDEAQNFLNEYDHEFQSTARSSRVATLYLTQNIAGIYAKIGNEHQARALIGNLRTKIFCSNDEYATNQWAADTIGKEVQYRHTLNQGTNTGTSTSESDSRSWGTNWGHSSSQQGGSSSSGGNRGGSFSVSHSHNQGQSRGVGLNETIDYAIQPAFFTSGLRTGGKANHYMVDAVLYHPARTDNFENGKNWTLCSFPQR